MENSISCLRFRKKCSFSSTAQRHFSSDVLCHVCSCTLYTQTHIDLAKVNSVFLDSFSSCCCCCCPFSVRNCANSNHVHHVFGSTACALNATRCIDSFAIHLTHTHTHATHPKTIVSISVHLDYVKMQCQKHFIVDNCDNVAHLMCIVVHYATVYTHSTIHGNRSLSPNP